MNRFGNYLRSFKLAKAHLQTASEKLICEKGTTFDAVRHLIFALRETHAAMNNLASMQFHKKPKPSRRPQSAKAQAKKILDASGINGLDAMRSAAKKVGVTL